MSFQRFPLNTVFWVKILVQKSRFCKTPEKKHTYTHQSTVLLASVWKIKMSLLTQQIQPEKFWRCDDVTRWPRYNGSCPESYKTTKAWYSKPTSQASVTQDWHRGSNMCQLEMMPSKNLLGLVSIFFNRESLKKSLLTPFFSDILVSKVWWVANGGNRVPKRPLLPWPDWIHPKPNKKTSAFCWPMLIPIFISPCAKSKRTFSRRMSCDLSTVLSDQSHEQSPGTGLHQMLTLEAKTSIV